MTGAAIIHSLAALLLLALPTLAQAKPNAVLIFDHSSGYRHESIPAAVEAIDKMIRAQGLEAVTAHDPSAFDGSLNRYAAIVLVSTTTDPKKPESEWFTGKRRAALQAFLARGGGVVGIHAAADSHYGWPWYRQMIGGKFARHPAGTPVGKIMRSATAHPALGPLPAEFSIADEYYWYDDLSPNLTHLLTLDPASIGQADANPKPLAWAHHFGGGRVFYSGLGHRSESWANPLMVAHIRAGLAWAAGTAKIPAMVIVDQATVKQDEPPPHGAIGMSTAYRISDVVPQPKTMEFRKRVLHKGAAIGLHPIAHDEVYYVLSGEGEVSSDGVSQKLKPGMAAYLYDGAVAGIKQVGLKPLTLIISYPVAPK